MKYLLEPTILLIAKSIKIIMLTIMMMAIILIENILRLFYLIGMFVWHLKIEEKHMYDFSRSFIMYDKSNFYDSRYKNLIKETYKENLKPTKK